MLTPSQAALATTTHRAISKYCVDVYGLGAGSASANTTAARLVTKDATAVDSALTQYLSLLVAKPRASTDPSVLAGTMQADAQTIQLVDLADCGPANNQAQVARWAGQVTAALHRL